MRQAVFAAILRDLSQARNDKTLGKFNRLYQIKQAMKAAVLAHYGSPDQLVIKDADVVKPEEG